MVADEKFPVEFAEVSFIGVDFFEVLIGMETVDGAIRQIR